MKWIKYQIVCNTINTGTEDEPLYENILLTKKVGYNDANLAIAQKEAYNGEYTIEEDEKNFEIEPVAIKFGGTGAKTVEEARANLGVATSDHVHDWDTLASMTCSFTKATMGLNQYGYNTKGVSFTVDNEVLKQYADFRYVIKAGSKFYMYMNSYYAGASNQDEVGIKLQDGLSDTFLQFYKSTTVPLDTYEFNYVFSEDEVIKHRNFAPNVVGENNLRSNYYEKTKLIQVYMETRHDKENTSYHDVSCSFTIELQGRR